MSELPAVDVFARIQLICFVCFCDFLSVISRLDTCSVHREN